jgi:hypothetical protein
MNWLQFFRPNRHQLAAATPRSAGYQFPLQNAFAMHFEQRPPFSLLTAEMMTFDPKVTIALAVRNGLLMNAEVEVADGRPEVMEFIAAQWERIWQNEGSKILDAKNFGFAGFEAMYREAPRGSRWDGRLLFDKLKDFHPRDIRPLIRKSEIVGLTLRNVKGKKANRDEVQGLIRSPGSAGKVPIWSPKSLWLTYGFKYGNLFGQALLEHAYGPWHEKHMRGGAIKLRQLRMVKDAWVGDVLRYPTGWSQRMPDGRMITGRDVAREVGENRYSGGVVGIPSDRDANGHELFGYETPSSVDGATGVFDYCDKLDTEILEALETPIEVLEALSSGSGFSGRSIPFIALLAILQEEFAEYVRQIDEQILRPLVRINFAVEPYYEIRPKSLIEVITDLMGKADSAGGGEATQQVAGGAPTMQQPTFGRQFSGSFSNPFDSYRQNRRFASVVSSCPRDNKARSFKSPDGGAVIGGIYYAAGRLVPASAVQFASDDELQRLPKATEPQAVGDDGTPPLFYAGSRRELMKRLSLNGSNGGR